MDDNNLFALIWKCVTTFACVATISMAGCVAHTHYQVTQALLNKVDPLAVACAHNNDNSSTDCAVLAAKR